MAIRQIIKIPDKTLTTVCEKVEFGKATEQLVQDLIDTLEAALSPKGAGLAAPQIGILERVCIVKKFTPDPDDPEKELEQNFILINPEIISHSDALGLGFEGCLSIPDTYGQVERHKRLKVESFDLAGNKFVMKAEGFFARVIQHEIDHLNGILFTTKIVGKTYTEKELDEEHRKSIEEKKSKIEEALEKAQE